MRKIINKKQLNFNQYHHGQSQSTIYQQAQPPISQYQIEFYHLHKNIVDLSSGQPKNMQIRVKQWLRKLQESISIEICQQNRNLYAKTLLLMLKKKSLTEPFNKMPPNIPLPILKLYQISYDIRKQLQKDRAILEKQSDYSCPQKENNSFLMNNSSFFDKEEKKLNKNRGKQRQHIQNRILLKTSSFLQNKEDTIHSEISQILRESYDFMLQNMERIKNKQKCQELLNQIWNESN